MSRIAKAPISIPSGVEVLIEEGTVRAKGPKGELSLNLARDIRLIQEEGLLSVETADATDKAKKAKNLVAMSGTTRAMVNNLIVGVSQGFERKLNIIGVGYRAQAQGNKLNLSLGFSHPVAYSLPEGVTAETPTQTEIVLRGTDKQVLGQVAAEIRSYRPPEPYKGKGIRYADEHVVRKQAKKK
ncbi:MAG: 50S ribosomal protein L6 [Gammaproteobacteria bacterium]|nr:50S ribosomal protein L6 [Gammaproteobacteria bacterium]